MAKPVKVRNQAPLQTGQVSLNRRQATPLLVSISEGGLEFVCDRDLLIWTVDQVRTKGYLVLRNQTLNLNLESDQRIWLWADRNATLYWRTK